MRLDLFVPIRRLLFLESVPAIRSLDKDHIRQVFKQNLWEVSARLAGIEYIKGIKIYEQ